MHHPVEEIMSLVCGEENHQNELTFYQYYQLVVANVMPVLSTSTQRDISIILESPYEYKSIISTYFSCFGFHQLHSLAAEHAQPFPGWACSALSWKGSELSCLLPQVFLHLHLCAGPYKPGAAESHWCNKCIEEFTAGVTWRHYWQSGKCPVKVVFFSFLVK